jgi:hypothetical protein
MHSAAYAGGFAATVADAGASIPAAAAANDTRKIN